MKKAIITTFTDPMMGLTYEMEPIYERLSRRESVQLCWAMGLLVRDIADFMLPHETIEQYNRRLAKICESEQSIGGLPISMPNLRLFDHSTARRCR